MCSNSSGVSSGALKKHSARRVPVGVATQTSSLSFLETMWTPWVLLARVCDGLSASPGHGRSGRHASLVTTHHSCEPMHLVVPSLGTTIPCDSTGSIYFNSSRRFCPAFSWHRHLVCRGLNIGTVEKLIERLDRLDFFQRKSTHWL